MKKKLLNRFSPPREKIKLLLVMKLTLALTVLTVFQANAFVYSQAVKVNIDARNASIENIIGQIREQSDYMFVYEAEDLREIGTLTLTLNDATVEDVLFRCLSGSDVTYVLKDNIIILRKAHQSPQQQPTPPLAPVKGTVKDSQGVPLPGVTIIVKGTNRGTSTDASGAYLLNVARNTVISFSYIGKTPREITFTGQREINVILEDNSTEIDDVVITGYQTLSKERATGSFSVITSEKLSQKIQPSILSRIEGLTAGLTSYKDDMRVRGTTTLQGNAEPLYVINGIPYEGSLDAINPSEIENITVLKDAAAASIYGARSANGVIVITTRGGKMTAAGEKGKTAVEYTTSFIIAPLKDNRDYLGLMNSKEMVDFQRDMFDIHHNTLSATNKRYFINPVAQLLYDRKDGIIPDDVALDKALDVYRNRDNYDQLVDNFLRRTSFAHQHNLSLRGGSEKFAYAASINYSKNMPYTMPSSEILTEANNLSEVPILQYEKSYNNERVGYNIRTTYNFFDWLRADLSMIGSFTNTDCDRGFLASEAINGGSAPYQVIFDENGNPLEWYKYMTKSLSERERLVSLGLSDEDYYPLKERKREHNSDKTGYYNVNIGFNAKIIEGLSFDLRYQISREYNHSVYTKTGDSYAMKQQINNATKIVNGKINHLIPTGGYISDGRRDVDAYVLRGQFNFERTFGDKHNVTAIAGAERNAKHTNATYLEKYGYDPQSLTTKVIDEVVLSSTQYGTEAVYGSYTHVPNSYPNNFYDSEDRYVSFYGNAAYTYDSRYSVTGSVKVEQSNLFGTDIRTQYKPFWHVGATWKIGNEAFMQNIEWLNYLSIRITYGVNGQVPKGVGPYPIFQSSGSNTWTGEYSNRIKSPPNSGLRWERTDVTNAGFDFRLFNNRLSGSFEWYNKKTTDLLSNISTDPTSGWSSLMLNYASLYNRGVEISLNSDNIKTRDFLWSTSLNFSYNKNMVTSVISSRNTVESYVAGNNNTSQILGTNTREGMPLGTLYSFRWAGLDENGSPQVYKKDGSIVKSMNDVEVEDLVRNGTIIPPYAAAMSNTVQYKGLSFSCLFIFYGGHQMRDAVPEFITAPEGYNGIASMYYLGDVRKGMANYWKTPADSNDPGKAPAPIIQSWGSESTTNLWYFADKHVLKGDYLKLREITLSYELPEKLLGRIGIRSLTLHAQVQNVWTWSANGKGHDPEAWTGVSNTYYGTDLSVREPLAPTIYSFGLTLKF